MSIKDMEGDWIKIEEDYWKNIELSTTEKRLLYILLVDHSGSTSPFIDDINAGLKNLVRTTQEQDGADAFDLMVFPFSSDVKKLIDSPVRAVNVDDIKPLKPDGFTRLDLALEMACNKMEGYKHGMDENIVSPDYWRPYIIIISDGLPTNDRGGCSEKERNQLVERCEQIKLGKHADIFTFFVGEDQKGIEFLKKLASPGSAFQIESTGAKIQQMFELLSNSVQVAQGKKFDFADPQFEL